MKNPLELCQDIMKFASADNVDMHAEKELKRAFFEYKQSQKRSLASASYLVNGVEYGSLLKAIIEIEKLQTLGIKFYKPNLEENWDYNVPTKSIALIGSGLGWVEKFDYKSFNLEKWDASQQMQRERVMLRAFPTRFYFPIPIKTKSIDPLAELPRAYIPKVVTLEELWNHIRSTGMVPLEIRLCAYTRNARYPYDLDLINNLMLKDFRGGQMPLTRKAVRSAMDYLCFDTVLAATDMKDLVKKVFIELFEVKEVTAFDISHSMGITDTMAKNALDALVAREVATRDGAPPRERYSFNPKLLVCKPSDGKI